MSLKDFTHLLGYFHCSSPFYYGVQLMSHQAVERMPLQGVHNSCKYCNFDYINCTEAAILKNNFRLLISSKDVNSR